MAERWYYKTRGGVRGPFAAEDLIAFLGDGVIAPTDLVRRGVGGPWRPVEEALADGAAVDDVRSDQIAARLLADIARAGARGFGGVSSASRTSRPPAADTRAIRKFLSAVGEFGAAAVAGGRVISAAGQLAKAVRSSATGRRILVAALASGLALGLSAVDWLPPSVSDHHRELISIRAAVIELRGRPASATEWRELSDRLQPRLARLAEAIERSETEFMRSSVVWRFVLARSDQETCARHDLFLVAKRLFPAILNSRSDGTRPEDAEADQRLLDVEAFLAGGKPYRGEPKSAPANSSRISLPGAVSVVVIESRPTT